MFDLPVCIIPKKIPHPSININLIYPLVQNLKNPAAQVRINRSIAITMNNILIEQSFYDKNLVEMGFFVN